MSWCERKEVGGRRGRWRAVEGPRDAKVPRGLYTISTQTHACGNALRMEGFQLEINDERISEKSMEIEEWVTVRKTR